MTQIDTLIPSPEPSAGNVREPEREAVSLRDTHFFGGMDPEAPDAFSAAANWHRFHEGQIIFDQESDGLAVHFIVRGRVRLLTAVDGGEPVTLAEVGTGDIFGELAAIDG